MLKPFIKYTLMVVMWKRYRRTILATVLLFAYLWLIGKVHNDFILYTEVNNSENHIGFSFLIKWFAYIIGVLVYIAYLFFCSDTTQKVKEINTEERQAPDDGAFEKVRSKQILMSRADHIIEKYPKNKK